MDSVILQSASKSFRSRPTLFHWLSRNPVHKSQTERNPAAKSWLGKAPSGATHALHEVSFSLAEGKVLVLLGPNGSGKTTTLKLVSTSLLPDSGRVLVHGRDTLRDSNFARQNVGFAIANERSFFPRLSARENLDFFAALNDVPRKLRKQRVEHLLERVGLSDAADTLAMNFSSGMYQRLGIARALLKMPSIVLLDEPTRSLDPSASGNFCQMVRDLAREGAAVLIASHNFQETAAVADSVLVLKQGRMMGHLQMHTRNALRRAESVATASEIRNFYFHAIGEPDSENTQISEHSSEHGSENRRDNNHEILAICG